MEANSAEQLSFWSKSFKTPQLSDQVREEIESRKLSQLTSVGMIYYNPIDQDVSNFIDSIRNDFTPICQSFYVNQEIKEMIKCVCVDIKDEDLPPNKICCKCQNDCVDDCACLENFKECENTCNCSNSRYIERPWYPGRIANYGELGFGIQAICNIPKGSLIGEFAGQIKIMPDDDKENGWSFQLFEDDSTIHVDCRDFGNFTKYLNHSCDPNCTVKHVCVRGLEEFRLFITADREIGVAEQLFINYGSNYFDETFPCKCASPKCDFFKYN